MLELEIDQITKEEKKSSPSSSRFQTTLKSFHWSKRLFDIVFSSAVLAIGTPLYLLIALGIKLSSSGGVFFVQNRLGKNGKIFKCYKFRTMVENAENVLPYILKSHPPLQQEWRQFQKLKNDPRIFPFGRFLRKSSLDELPQFWNVLKGELSVVGPRPYMVEQRHLLREKEKKILSITPGVTGLWQTTARNHHSFTKRILLDEEYIDKQSFVYDLTLIGKTIPIIFFAKSGY